MAFIHFGPILVRVEHRFSELSQGFIQPYVAASGTMIALNIFRFNQVENVANEQWRNAMSIDRALAYNGL